MTWLNPLALVGLLAVAVPVLIHLFGRRLARKQRFPSLRLLRIAAPSASTSTTPSDLLLLFVRCLVIAAAAFALGQPSWFLGRRDATPSITRVIIVDTSASMRRLSANGLSAIENARSLGSALLDSAQQGLVIETARPGANVAAAGSWLVRHQGMRELVVVSDFQWSALDDGDLSHVPAGVGVRPVRIEVAGGVAADDSLDGVRLTLTETETRATWESQEGEHAFPFTVLHAAEDAAAIGASIEAVRSYSGNRITERTVTLVFPGHAGMSQLKSQARELSVSWQGDLLLALGAHPLILGLRETPVVADCPVPGGGPVLDASGRIVAQVAAGQRPSEVVVFSCVHPGTVGAAALIAAVSSTMAPPDAYEELEPVFVPDETLDQWRRPPVDAAPRDVNQTTPLGRLFWLAALLLLLLEEWIRRRVPKRVVTATIPGRRADAA